MMMKMGFKGRLGLHEDGIAEPVPMSQRLKGSNKEGVGVARRLPKPAKGKPTNGTITAAKAMSSVAAQRDPADELRLRSEEKRRKRLAKKSEPKEKDREDDPNADLNYEFETDDGDGDNAFDNGRRGVVVDFNLLITNARSRQSEVLRQLKLSFFDADNVHIDQIMKQYAYDFCDMPLIEALLEQMGATEYDDARQMLYDWVDQTFESCEKPELNSVMINALRQWSRRSRVYIGILHRGSRRRALRETNALGIDDLISNMSFGSINSEETWPYVKSTRLLLCRMGVRPPQTLVITQRLSRDDKLSAGGIAGYILGARTLSVSLVAPMKIEPEISCMDPVSNVTVTDKLDDGKKINDVALGELFENSDGIIKHLRRTGLHKRKKSARVLALRSGDQQYHCGVIEYGLLDDENGKSLVRFYSHGDREWISNSVIDGANRRAYRILRRSKFPSLLAPEDVDALDV